MAKQVSIITFLLFFVGINSNLFSQNQLKKLCQVCDGKGRTRTEKKCPNCSFWTNYQKQVNPCNVCRNTRYIYSGTNICSMCEGKGYQMHWNLSPNLEKIYRASTAGWLDDNQKNAKCWNLYKFNYINRNQIKFTFSISNSEDNVSIILVFNENNTCSVTAFNDGQKVMDNIQGSYDFYDALVIPYFKAEIEYKNNKRILDSHHICDFFVKQD